MEKAKAGVAHCVTIREDVLGLHTGGTYAIVKLELPRTIGDGNMEKVQEALRAFVQTLQEVAEDREADAIERAEEKEKAAHAQIDGVQVAEMTAEKIECNFKKR